MSDCDDSKDDSGGGSCDIVIVIVVVRGDGDAGDWVVGFRGGIYSGEELSPLVALVTMMLVLAESAKMLIFAVVVYYL